MCFYSGDCDWYAEINEETILMAEKSIKCDECYMTIPAGGWVKHIHQQENELCSRCDESEDERFNYDSENEDCKAGKHDYGETYDYDRCELCDKVLRAIEQAEIEEGCKGDETQPHLCGLREEMFNIDREERKRYLDRVRLMFPEAVEHAVNKLGMVVDEEEE